MKIKNFCIKFLAVMCSSAMLISCGGDSKVQNTEEEIELLYPVGVSENIVHVERRDLMSYKVYSGKVVPKVMEYAFSSDKTFKNYNLLPGSPISKGEAIAYSSTTELDTQIENLEKSIQEAKENYDEEIKELREDLANAKSQEAYWAQVVENCENMTDAERNSYTDGYMDFDAAYKSYKDTYGRRVAQRERIEENIKEKVEFYELNSAHDKDRLSILKKKKADNMVISGMDGIVVAANFFEQNSYVSKNYSVGAVGDFSRLLLKSDNIAQSDIKKAAQLYAIVNGKKYDLVYSPEDKASEYDRELTSTGESYSTFEIVDPNKEIKSGDYAVVVLVNKIAEDVMCVPTEAVNSNEDGDFVYVKEDEEIRSVYVKTGLKSGYYTEIESGLSDTDCIVSEFRTPVTTSTATLSMGSVSSEFSETGYLFYSKQDAIKNTIKNGVVYIQSVSVKQYERVTKGQVIAEISVTGDSIALARKERSLLRKNETLLELIKESETDNAKLIKRQRESIAELEKEIAEMKADFACTTIVAPYDGIITGIQYFQEGDIVRYESTIATIAEESNCYVIVEDQNGLLNYGNEARVEYKDAAGKQQTAIGSVVTVAPCALSKDLNTGYALISVPAEDLAVMASTNQGNDGWWMRSHFSVKVKIRSVDDVLLVPKKAVKTEGGMTYVIVMDENNNPVYKSFIAGGSDNNNYWVVSGLVEGQEICLE